MRPLDDLLRDAAPKAIGVLVRRFGDFASCEDAVQDALLAAATQWPVHGVPDNPTGWVVTVASRRRIELYRADEARRRREAHVVAEEVVGPGAVETDDALTVLLMCCHPVLTVPSQVALTLRAVGGLTTAEIARAFLVPEATIAQRVSRAKQRIREAGATLDLPPLDARSARVAAALGVLYLIFTEGHTASAGPTVDRRDLTAEAARLARQLRARLPGDGEVTGLLALMLLTDARRAARIGPDGAMVSLAAQDRRKWNRDAIKEGVALLEWALAHTPVGPYQLQAAIAAVHAEATQAAATDWPQILGLYDVLQRLCPGPMVTLNRAVAVAMVHGSRAALDQLDAAQQDATLAAHHRLDAVRAHLLEQDGDIDGARQCFERAARRALSMPERQYLETQGARLRVGGGDNREAPPSTGERSRGGPSLAPLSDSIPEPRCGELNDVSDLNLVQATLIALRTERHLEELRAQYLTILKMAQGLGRMGQYRTPPFSLMQHDLTRWSYGRPWISALNSGDPTGAAYRSIAMPLERPDAAGLRPHAASTSQPSRVRTRAVGCITRSSAWKARTRTTLRSRTATAKGCRRGSSSSGVVASTVNRNR